MKTVGEFKKAGLAFVKGDCGDNFLVKNPVSFNSYGASFEDDLVKNFSWRKNTGVKPDFSGAIEVLIGNNANEEHFICESASEVPWDLNKISRVLEWRPSLNQPSLSVESDTKESAIHKAWVDLKGDISNLLERDERSDIYVSLCIDGMGHGFFAGKYYGTGENPTPSMFEKICTIKEFTDYREKMAAEEKSIKHLSEQIKDINGKQLEINRKFKGLAAEEKRMDIIGQNCNDGLHYDQTAQQVVKCSCIGCDNESTHTWSGHPTCDDCGTPSRSEAKKAVEALALKQPSEKMKVALKEADDIGKGFVTRCVMMPINPKFIDNETANAKVKAHIESLRPIFTQAMADDGELPPVGSLVDVVGKNGLELTYGEGEKNCEVLAHIENTAVIRMSFGLGCFHPDALKASNTRTDREKAIDAMLKDSRCNGSVIEICIERLYDAGYRKC